MCLLLLAGSGQGEELVLPAQAIDISALSITIAAMDNQLQVLMVFYTYPVAGGGGGVKTF